MAPKLPRLFIWGSEIDDALIRMVEESGAFVVMDDLCTGTRFFWDDVPETGDPLDGLARRYLQTRCPRSYEARTVIEIGGQFTRAVSEALGLEVRVPENSRLTAALGAVCLAEESPSSERKNIASPSLPCYTFPNDRDDD